MLPEISVKVGGKDYTVLYSPANVIAAPAHVARAAVEEAERQFMEKEVACRVRESVGDLYVTTFGQVQSLRDFIGEGLLSRSLRVACLQVVDGVAEWEIRLLCDECDGTGGTYTTRGTPVSCPTCNEGGVTSFFRFNTDMVGRFVGYGDFPVSNYGRYDAGQFMPRELAEALAITAGEWA